MRKIFLIFAADIKQIFTHWSMIIIALGVLCIPPLYAWINIYAFWDPYANMKNMEVCVSNVDTPVSFTLRDMLPAALVDKIPQGGVIDEKINLNIGEQVIDSLSHDNTVKWNIASYDDGQYRLKNGYAYAFIAVPRDFSQTIRDNVMSTSNPSTISKPKNAQLECFVNEKENAIANEITSIVINSLQEQINSSIMTEIISELRVKSTKLPYKDIQDFINSYLNIVESMFSNTDSNGINTWSILGVDTIKEFPIESYGAGMAPFYTVLSIWVGSLFLGALFAVKVKNYKNEFSPMQGYFAKMLLFVLFGIMQGVIVTLGDYLLLRMKMQSVLCFTLLGAFYGMIFSMIIYTLTANLGNIGKALGIVIMLLQISASGGTFPIQTMPGIIRVLYNIVPFTYAINGLREVIGGVVQWMLLKDILILAAFLVGAFILGAVMYKPLTRLTKKFNEDQEKSNILH